MYTVYVSDYKKDGSYVTEPALMFDTRSPAKDVTVLDPVCDLEDSKAGSFSFILPLNHWLYDTFEKKRTLVTIWRDKGNENKEKIIFEGVVTSTQRDLHKNKTIYCEGFATFLNDTCQPRKEYLAVTIKDYVEALIANHNSRYSTRDRKFEVVWDDDNLPSFPGTKVQDIKARILAVMQTLDPTSDEYKRLKQLYDSISEVDVKNETLFSVYEATQYDSTFAYLQDLQSRAKGHFIFSVNPDENSPCKYLLKYVKDIPEPEEGAQEIRFGVNLLDYADNYDFTNICTSILPIANPSNYSESPIGEIVGMFPDGNKVVGEFIHLTEKIHNADHSEEWYQFTDQNTNNGDYIYVINCWPSVDNENAFFSTGGAHHLLKVVDNTKLAETVTDPNERWKAFKKVSGSTMVFWAAQLGNLTSTGVPYAKPFNLIRHDNQDFFVARYFRKEVFPTGNAGVYYIDDLNDKVYIWNVSRNDYDEVTGSLKDQIIGLSFYHVVSYHIPYYTYRGDVAHRSDLPATAPAGDAYYVTEQGVEGYFTININDNTWYEIDAIDKSVIGELTPGVDRLYVTTRAINQSVVEGSTTNFLWSIAYHGAELDRQQMSDNTNTGTWNSISDNEFDIALSSGANKYYKAQVLNVAGWGNSLRTVIKKGTYSYKTTDATIGDRLSPSAYSSYSDAYEVVTPNRRDEWPNGYINNWVSYNRTGYYNNGVCINELTSGKTEHYDIHDKEAVYVTTRMSQSYSPNHGSPCLWLLTDASDQVIYTESLSSGTTTEVNTLIDKSDNKFAGAYHLVVNKWGNMDIEVHEYIKSVGGLTDYITAEGAEDYYYYSYEHHIDRTKVHEKGSLYVENPALIDIYGRIERKVEFKNVGDPNTLVKTATNYLMNTQYDDISIMLTGVDMHNLNLDVEAFDISKKYPVVSAPHGINKNMPIKSLRIALNSPQDNEISLGETKTLAERLDEGGLDDG